MPDPIMTKLRAVEAQIQAGELASALAALDRVRTEARGDVRVCLVEATLARAGNDAVKEIAALDRAISLTPRWPVIHIERCKALGRMEKTDEALAAAVMMVDVAPNDLAALELAVSVANLAGAHAFAERCLRAALALRPGDVAIMHPLAISLYDQRRFAEAEPFYRTALGANPDSASALAGLGACLTELGRAAEAVACFERALSLQPGDPRFEFYLALARGETPPTQPAVLTEKLFDNYSGRFDAHLTGELKYRVPGFIADIVRRRHPLCDIDVLDLGCGTGLIAVNLGKVSGAFVGVDLSANMLQRAQCLGIYTRLRHGDLRSELDHSAADSYDYIIAADVFIYVGDLADLIPFAFRALRPGGALIFSCETAADSEGDFVLRPSKRYAHSRAYVERLCRDAGFGVVGFEEIELRMEERVPISGYIVVAEKA
ncbi:MAG: methyltransferase domain-containing protein [Rudaea sp.]|uniref:methyltransferase domain-containing protein n=1 Tax=unclassified Rudaea TaxID=2627037 RepID=UPI0014854A94|nr:MULTISPECIES: methyltransferase domain-containing protein [unclassified Rudaea]MBN8885737.1 methyltransferase domain-containing protein [Rudaea sp.]MBR0346483.1 methyltransferase domain-containing protein [Rudaea sp.]